MLPKLLLEKNTNYCTGFAHYLYLNPLLNAGLSLIYLSLYDCVNYLLSLLYLTDFHWFSDSQMLYVSYYLFIVLFDVNDCRYLFELR